jgi:hypothetical protein
MKKLLLSVFVVSALLLAAPSAFAEHDGTREAHTEATVTSVSATGAPIEMQIKLQTDTGVQITSVEPVTTAAPAAEMCGGTAKPALSCPRGYMVGCNKVGGEKWACVKDPSAPAVETSTSAGAGAQTGASSGASMGASTKTETRDMDDDGDTVLTILEDAAFKGPAFMKFEDIKGESSEGEARQGSSGKTKIVDDTEVDFSVDAKKVRGWDTAKKEELAKSAPQSSDDVTTQEELALFVAAQAEGDPRMEQVSLNFTKIEFRYQSDAKLFGVFPFKLSQDILLNEKTVSVKNPWYSFLVSGGLTVADLEEAAKKKKDKGHKDTIEIASWSFGASNAGKVNVAVGDVNGDGVEASATGEAEITLKGLATNFAVLLDTVKSASNPEAE